MTKRTKPTKVPQSAYNQEFRDTAIQLALAGNKSIAEVARELGLPEWKLYAWVQSWRKANSKDAGNNRVAGNHKGAAEEELRKLQKRNKELEMENEILKKAAAYFAKSLL
jgi:transposase-like protein